MAMIIKEYIQLGIVTIMFLVFVIFDIKRYRVIKWEKVPKHNQKYVKKREKKINFWVRFGITAFLSLTMLLSIPRIMDFPAFVTGNYEMSTGEVLSCQMLYKKDLGRKTVELKNENTGKVISVELYSCPNLSMEENITIKYLKHTKIGVLVKRGENE